MITISIHNLFIFIFSFFLTWITIKPIIASENTIVACRKNSDCVVTRGPCKEPKSINKKFLDEYTRGLKKTQTLILCKSFVDQEWPEKVFPICKANKCAAMYPKKPKRKKPGKQKIQ